MAAVSVADEQDEVAIDTSTWEELASFVVTSLGFSDATEVALRFVSSDEITVLNEQYLGHEGPTDVLSFPIEEPYELAAALESAARGQAVAPLLLGDVVICPSVAARQAVAHELSTDDELALLLVHGILHLIGMDHELDAEAVEMEKAEQRLLCAARARAEERAE